MNEVETPLSVGGTKRTVQGEWDRDFIITPVVHWCNEALDNFGSFYVFCAPEQLKDLLAFRQSRRGACYGGHIVWDKPNAVWSLRKSTWRWTHENVAWGRHQKATWNFLSQEEMRTIQTFGNITTTGHPTGKNPAMLERFLMVSSNDGDMVFDPFLGSGTTFVACERLGRLGRGVEIEPKYVAVTLERLAGLGLTPQRVSQMEAV